MGEIINKIRKYTWYTLLLFALVIPISSFLSTRILMLFLFFSLFQIKSFKLLKYVKASWDVLLYFLILLIGLFNSTDSITGIRLLETSFSLLAVSIGLITIDNFDRIKLNKIFIAFSIGVFVAGTICLLAAGVNFIYTNYDPKVFFYYNFTNIIQSHPTYLAYYLIFSITYALYSISYENVNIPVWVRVFFILLCFSILLLTGGQTSFIALIFVFSFFLLKNLMGQGGRFRSVNVSLVTVMLVSIFIYSYFEFSHDLNDTWDRFELWHSGIMANSDLIWGVGTGDYREALNNYYTTNNKNVFAIQSLNSHNQFIQTFFSNGVLGLISISLLIWRPLYRGFKNNDQLAILVIFPFLIYGTTEVFLGRYQGVAFFALLHQIFIIVYLNSTPLNKGIDVKT